MNKHIEPIRILIVEDNPTDARLLSEILKELELKMEITVVRDGQQALDMLAEERIGPSNPAPDFVILDLNLPKVHGYEVLSFIRSGSLRSIPVAVMTGSLNREDEVKARRMGATHYLLKPAS
jgi:CheY-like chemotaxis protein